MAAPSNFVRIHLVSHAYQSCKRMLMIRNFCVAINGQSSVSNFNNLILCILNYFYCSVASELRAAPLWCCSAQHHRQFGCHCRNIWSRELGGDAGILPRKLISVFVRRFFHCGCRSQNAQSPFDFNGVDGIFRIAFSHTDTPNRAGNFCSVHISPRKAYWAYIVYVCVFSCAVQQWTERATKRNYSKNNWFVFHTYSLVADSVISAPNHHHHPVHNNLNMAFASSR